MKSFSFFAASLMLTGLVISSTGCGPSGPPQYKVTGKVTYNGEVIPEGTVNFLPVGTGPVAYGNIKPDGTYSLETNDLPGAFPGSYKVSIVALKDNGPERASTELLPSRFSSEQTSGLTAEVKADQENVVDFALTGKPMKTKAPPVMP